jgi:hypothetical protein
MLADGEFLVMGKVGRAARGTRGDRIAGLTLLSAIMNARLHRQPQPLCPLGIFLAGFPGLRLLTWAECRQKYNGLSTTLGVELRHSPFVSCAGPSPPDGRVRWTGTGRPAAPRKMARTMIVAAALQFLGSTASTQVQVPTECVELAAREGFPTNMLTRSQALRAATRLARLPKGDFLVAQCQWAIKELRARVNEVEQSQGPAPCAVAASGC